MDSRVKKNAAWIIGCRIAQSLLALVISMLTARYMGPSNYGLLTYAQSLCTFVVPIVQLGLNWIIVYELINNPDDEESILGTSIFLSILSALLCICGLFLFTNIANTGEKDTILVCLLFSVNLVFQAIELIQYWYQANYLSKYTSIVSLVSYVIVSCYKIFLLATKKSIYWFAISHSIDYCIIGITLFLLYSRLSNKSIHFSKSIAKRLINNSKYYIITGLMINVFMQTDRVMLKIMVGNISNGIYSAAGVCASMGSFVFVAIIDSMRPLILQNKKDNNGMFEQSTKQLYSVILYASFAYAIALTIFSRIMVSILYGSDYLASSGVLKILAWCMILQYYGGAKDIWILAEEKQKYLVPLNASGAVINLLLNLILIRYYSEMGAAIASLITLFFTNVVMIAMIPSLRHNTLLLFASLNPRYLTNSAKNLLNRLGRKIIHE